MAGVACLGLALGGCGAEAVGVAGFEDVAWAAGVVLGARGDLVEASEVRAFAKGSAFEVVREGSADVVIVGWSAAAFGGVVPDAKTRLTAREGCAPRLPVPLVAARVGADGAVTAVDVAALPALSAAWAEELCPERAIEAVSLRASCLEERPAWTFARKGRCAGGLTLPPLEGARDARIDPDGALCIDGCTSMPPSDGAAQRFTCDACSFEVFTPPAAPALTATRVALLEVAPYLPKPAQTGASPQVPTEARFFGHAYDLAVVGDRVLVSTGTGTAHLSCTRGDAPGLLHARALPSLAPIAMRPSPSCLTLLTATGTTAAGVYVEGDRYRLGRFDRDLNLTASAPLDALPGCGRAIELLADGARLHAVIERAPRCADPGTAVFTIDARSLRTVSRRDLPVTTGWRAIAAAGRFYLADAIGRAVHVHALPDLTEVAVHTVSVDSARADTHLFELAFDVERGELLATSIRRLPALHRFEPAGTGFFVEHEADPVALLAAPFSGAHGLAIGTRDGDPRAWPSTAALYDRATLTVLPGEVPVGSGPPRRLVRDATGAVLALFPWDATLFRITP